MQHARDRPSAGSPAAAGWSRALACALALLGPIGCTDDRVLLDSAASSTGGPSPGTIPTSGSSSTSPTTGLADDTTGTTSTSTDDPGVIFLPIPDVGTGTCNIFDPECPPGFKCVAWGNDGGSSWNAYGCKPVVENPVGIDEVCHVEGSIASGIDDCELGAMCWFIDPETHEGICVPLCLGSESFPLCEDEGRFPYWHGSIPLCQCMLNCDPIQQDCAEGRGCYPLETTWMCMPDASADAGAYGDTCVLSNTCDPGLVCVDASMVPACESVYPCCTEICDLADPLGDLQCAGAAEGQQCVPFQDVGVCILPQ